MYHFKPLVSVAICGWLLALAAGEGLPLPEKVLAAATSPRTSLSRPYFPAGPVEEGWPADALLVYSGYYPPGQSGLAGLNHDGADSGTVREDDGDWLPGDFLPYVAHLDASGEPDDTFFDTFIFLGTVSPRGRHFGGEYGQDRASLWYDWQWYIDRLFAPGKQLAALEEATARVAEALARPDLAVNVYIMIPYPSYKVTDFGSPVGDGGGKSLLPVANRLEAVRWYVDEVLHRWEARRTELAHLRLAGFYWMQEHVNPEVPGEGTLVRGTADYVHQKGLKLGWIPWSGAYLATSWRSYGFDWAVTQPNHMFQDQPGLIKAAVDRARTARMGIEIELDGRVKQPQGARKLYDYLNAGVEYGFVRDALIAYYQDVCMLAQLYAAGGELRRIYDDVYAFAKGTYPEPTAAAWHISGTVVDEKGSPVAGARIQAGEVVTFTGADGRFHLPGIYRKRTDLLVSKPGDDGFVQVVSLEAPGPDGTRGSRITTVSLVVAANQLFVPVFNWHDAPRDDDTAPAGVTALGWKPELDRERQGVLVLSPRAGPGAVRSIFFDLGDKELDVAAGAGAEPGKASFTALALDVKLEIPPGILAAPGSPVPTGVVGEAPAAAGPVRALLLLTLLDGDGNLYTRSYPIPIPPAGWQTLVLPLAAAAEGREHVDALGTGAPGGVALDRIVRITLTFSSPASLTGGETSSLETASLELANIRFCR